MAPRYPHAKWDPMAAGPSFTDVGEPKGCLHTTEGTTYAGARAAYVKNRSAPHFTASFERGWVDVWQHVDVDRGARALQNKPGGVQTNADRVIQIELVGTCNPPNRGKPGWLFVEDFPLAYLNGIGQLMRWIEKTCGVPRSSEVRFKAYPASYGTNGVRLAGPAFDAYSGWLGHQHVPENSHGDPGLIDISYLLRAGTTPAPLPPIPPEVHMALGIIDYLVDPHGHPDDKGRWPCWGITAQGNVYAFNGAVSYGGYGELVTAGKSAPRNDFRGIEYVHDAAGNPGYVLICDDFYSEPDSHNVSTYAFFRG